MERTISIERTYVLGQYKNIKMFDSISDIPEDIFFNPKAMDALRTLQILQIDSTYLKYLKKSVTLGDSNYKNNPQELEELLAGLDNAKVSTFESFMEAKASVQTISKTEDKE